MLEGKRKRLMSEEQHLPYMRLQLGEGSELVVSMADAKRLKWFSDHYAPIVDFQLITGEKHYLGKRAQRHCRFCDRSEPKVTFHKQAHALPEFIGNKSLLSQFECDSCNDLFSEAIEDHFAKFFAPFNTLSQIRGKRGIPTYRSSTKKSRIEVGPDALQITAHADDDLIRIDEEKRVLTVQTIPQPFVPVAVYKCLTKMGLSVLPESEVEHYVVALRWIRDRDHRRPVFAGGSLICLYTFVPGPHPLPGIKVLLFQRKRDADLVPHMVFVVAFGNWALQVFLPFSSQDQHLVGRPMKLAHFPTPYGEHGEPIRRAWDLSSADTFTGKPFPVVMHFDSIEEATSRDDPGDTGDQVQQNPSGQDS